MSYAFPPAGALGRTPEELLSAAHVFYDAQITPMLNGVCPHCAATVDHTVTGCEDHERDPEGLCPTCDTRFAAWTTHECRRCGYSRTFVPWFKLLTEPAVVAFYHEHGGFDRCIPFIELTDENAPFVRDITQTFLSADPVRVRVEMPLGDARLTVVVDGELDIVDIERSVPGRS